VARAVAFVTDAIAHEAEGAGSLELAACRR
jgi:hypothetical protein